MFKRSDWKAEKREMRRRWIGKMKGGRLHQLNENLSYQTSITTVPLRMVMNISKLQLFFFVSRSFSPILPKEASWRPPSDGMTTEGGGQNGIESSFSSRCLLLSVETPSLSLCLCLPALLLISRSQPKNRHTQTNNKLLFVPFGLKRTTRHPSHPYYSSSSCCLLCRKTHTQSFPSTTL